MGRCPVQSAPIGFNLKGERRRETVADRKQFFGEIKADPELVDLLKAPKLKTVPEDDLREQRISFAFGNAPADVKSITKDSVRHASKKIRLT